MSRAPETGVTVEATIKLKFIVYGEVEARLRKGEDVTDMVEALVEDTIECCGLAGEDMTVKDFEYSLND